jgi:hypothetical protein
MNRQNTFAGRNTLGRAQNIIRKQNIIRTENINRKSYNTKFISKNAKKKYRRAHNFVDKLKGTETKAVKMMTKRNITGQYKRAPDITRETIEDIWQIRLYPSEANEGGEKVSEEDKLKLSKVRGFSSSRGPFKYLFVPEPMVEKKKINYD